MGGSPSKERRPSPKKKRESFYTRWTSPSSWKERLGPYSNKVEKRVVRRREKQSRPKAVSRKKSAWDESESENEKKGKKGKTGLLTGMLSAIENHPNAPSIMITYLQLFSNFLLIAFGVYVVYSLWSGILGDVDKDVNEAASATMLEIIGCKEDWKALRCDDRIERTRSLCDELAKCVSQDPKKVARGQVSAKTFAKIINEFAEPISLKAMFFYLSIFGIFWYTTNATWNGLRNKLSAEHVVHYVHGHGPHPAATPSRHASAGQLPFPQGTPYHPSVGYYGWNGMMPVEGMQQQQQAASGALESSPRKVIELS